MMLALKLLRQNLKNFQYATWADRICSHYSYNSLVEVFEEQEGRCALTGTKLAALVKPPEFNDSRGSSPHQVGFRRADNRHGFEMIGASFAYFPNFRIVKPPVKTTTDLEQMTFLAAADALQSLGIPMRVSGRLEQDQRSLLIAVDYMVWARRADRYITFKVADDKISVFGDLASSIALPLADSSWLEWIKAIVLWSLDYCCTDNRLIQPQARASYYGNILAYPNTPIPPWRLPWR